MSTYQKVLVYLIGVVLGLMILTIIPRPEREVREHPWHAQTAPEGTYPLSYKDHFDRNLELNRQPRYFISLAPSVTETLFAMGMGDHLYAVSRWCRYPEEADNLRAAGAHIGDMDTPNREMILEYRPDLVLGSHLTPLETYQQLHNPPRTVAVAMRFETVADIYQAISDIGRITGVPGHANRLIHSLRERESAVAKRLEPYRSNNPRSVVFLLDIEEDLRPGWAAGQGTYIDDLIRMSHGRNPVAGIGSSWGQLQLEALVGMNPDVILVKRPDSAEARQLQQDQIRRLRSHPVWSQLDAVRNHRVIAVAGEYLNIPGPRTFDALEDFAAAIW